MLEAIHAAAFSNNTLGLPKMCPSENVDGSINRQVYLSCMNRNSSQEKPEQNHESPSKIT